MLFVFYDHSSLSLSFSIDPFSFKNLSIWICIFSNPMLSIILIYTFKLWIICPFIKTVPVLSAIKKVALIYFSISVYYPTFSVDMVILEEAFVTKLRSYVFSFAVFDPIKELSFIKDIRIIFVPSLFAKPIRQICSPTTLVLNMQF